MPDPSLSNGDSLKLQLLTARNLAGHSGQFTPGGYLSAVIHTTLDKTRQRRHRAQAKASMPLKQT